MTDRYKSTLSVVAYDGCCLFFKRADEYEVDPIDVLMSDASSVIASLEDPLPRLLFNLEELLWFIAGMELYRV